MVEGFPQAKVAPGSPLAPAKAQTGDVSSTPKSDQSAPKKKSQESLHQILADDLRMLQERAAKFEDKVGDGVADDAVAEIAKDYREQAKLVRAEILNLNRAAAAELQRQR